MPARARARSDNYKLTEDVKRERDSLRELAEDATRLILRA
jgi:hypothetical protein